MQEKLKKRPSAILSFMPIVMLVAMLACTIRSFGSDALAGASQVTLLAASALCVLIGMAWLNVPWAAFEKAITKNVASVASALVMLLLIGALSGAWMTSGVVPTLIYYGMKIIHPDVFLPSACITCAIVSIITGSSWTTIATIGLALMGIGKAEGFSDGWIAGAIISGSYFGDKISPLSDTTVLASSGSGVPLMTHIRYMLVTTVPSIAVALTVFTVYGIVCDTGSAESATSFAASLQQKYNITPWLLAVPALTGVMIAKRVPPLITLFVSTVLAVAFAIAVQREILTEIDTSLYRAALKSVYGSTSVSTGDATLDALVATRGMAGMMDTIWIIVCAMCFGGAMSAGGMVGGITRLFIHLAKGRTTLVGSTASSGLMLNLAIADQYLCILLTGNMFKDVFDRQGYERRLLSRTVEDSVTVTSVLVPWNTCGMTQSTVLGVSTLTYLPYCLFNIISPVMSVLVAALGFRIYRHDRP